MYQTDWQNIPFAEFAELSSTELAGPAFYEAFYREFFQRFRSWEDLAPSWRQSKEDCAAFILKRTPRPVRILSIGCGLGIIEHFMRTHDPSVDLFVQEVAPSAWRWIDREFADSKKLTGHVPACLPPDILFGLVFLSAVDYALDDASLSALLRAVRPHLAESGQCLIISASFERTPLSMAEHAAAVWSRGKAVAASILDWIRIRPRGQFWGWTRTQAEYRAAMRRAGFEQIEDGFVDGTAASGYWIAGTA